MLFLVGIGFGVYSSWVLRLWVFGGSLCAGRFGIL